MGLPAKLPAEGNRRQLRRVVMLVALAIALGYVVPRMGIGSFLVSPLAREEIIAFLSSVSSGMMAFTGIVFSLLFVLLQFGTTAYTPRIVDILGRNSTFYDAAGVFAGTFFYSLMALRGVGAVGDGRTSQVPLYVAFAWLLASVYMLLKLVQSVALMTHTAILHLLADRGRAEIDRVYGPSPMNGSAVPREPEIPVLPVTAPQKLLHTEGMRYLVALDVDGLVQLARSYHAVIRVPLALGDPVADKMPLALVYGAVERVPEDRLRSCIVVARERVLEGNPKYAIRLLVDIAVRALSPAVNDPTTAVQALDQLESLLLHLCNHDLDVGSWRDSTDKLRLVHEVTSWEDYVDLSLTEIQQYGAGSVQVDRRIAALLAVLSSRVPAHRRAALNRWATRHQLALDESSEVGVFRDEAVRADPQGLGHTWSAH
jgi:uncharacterized membrane protein